MILRFLLGPIATPLSETADGLGAGAPAAAVVTDTPAGDDEGSLSDHEASFSQDARRATPESGDVSAEPAERDDTGKFVKPRHRAASQKATAADVGRIGELTKNWRTAEAERDALKAEREVLARERDELKARYEKPAAAEPAKPATTPVTASDKFTFPKFETFVETNPGVDYDGWELERFMAYDAWKDARLNLDDRISHGISAREAARQTNEIVEATRTKGRDAYPDFDAMLKSGPGAGVNLGADEATSFRRVLTVLKHPQSEHLQYAIMKDGALAHRLAGLDDIAFGIELSTLVALQRPTPTRTAADSTRAARATPPPIAPKPPTLVRTGASRDADALPGDDSSLAEHEQAFSRRRRA